MISKIEQKIKRIEEESENEIECSNLCLIATSIELAMLTLPPS